MRVVNRVRPAALAGLATLAIAWPTAPLTAAEDDVALIKGYVGGWRGRGEIQWGDGGQESILCRMNVEDSAPTKIGVDGRCSLAGATLNMLGTIAYVEENRRYEAIVSSNTQFSGIAVGRRSGDNLTFALRDYKGDDNQRYDVSAEIDLSGDSINVSMSILNKDSGDLTIANVPFARR
jgi:hypothetical protein